MDNFDLDTKGGMTQAVAWTERLFASLKDGGRWFIPRSGVTVIVNHATRTATLKSGYRPDPSIERVIRAMGWKVEY